MRFVAFSRRLSLTNGDVHSVYFELNMPMNSEEEPITLVVKYLVCSEPHRKVLSFLEKL